MNARVFGLWWGARLVLGFVNAWGGKRWGCVRRSRGGAAWDEALAADQPVILEAYTDPNVPPHTTLKDAAHFMSMMATEPELGSVLKNSAKDLLATVMPGKE